MRTSLAVLAMAGCLSAANAEPTFSWRFVDNDTTGMTDVAVDVAEWADAGYVTIDLIGDFGDDHWTTAYAYAEVTDGAFWNHPNGDASEMAPDTNNFAFLGLTRFDSFYTGMNDYPNAEPGAGDAHAAPNSPLQNTATVREMEWFDYPAMDNTGEFVMARFTVLPSGGPIWLEVSGFATTVEGGTAQYPFYLPEPTSLALLGLGALAVIRRR